MNKIKNTTGAATMVLALSLCAGLNRLQAQSVYEPYTFTTFAGGGGWGSADARPGGDLADHRELQECVPHDVLR